MPAVTSGAVLAYAALGIGLGAGSSVLPGPCGLAVLDAARRYGLPRALATSAGAALGDVTYATLGILGIGRLLAYYPGVPLLLRAISSVALVAFGLAYLLRRAGAASHGGTLGGFVAGYLTLLANPAALVTWAIVVGGQLVAATPLARWCAVAGIGAGTFCWFSATAVLAARGNRILASPRVPAICGSLFIAWGIVSLVRMIALVA